MLMRASAAGLSFPKPTATLALVACDNMGLPYGVTAAALVTMLSSTTTIGFHVVPIRGFQSVSKAATTTVVSHTTASFKSTATHEQVSCASFLLAAGASPWRSTPARTSRLNIPVMMAASKNDEDVRASSTGSKMSRKAAKKAKARGDAGGGAGFAAGGTGGGGAGSGDEVGEIGEAPATSIVTEFNPSLPGVEPTMGSAEAEAARKAIQKMEEVEQERVAARQSRIENVMKAREASEEDPDAGTIPEVVSNRMLKRMIPFFLGPAIVGIGVFAGTYVLSHNYDYTIPAYLVAYATQAPFFIALVGITYAILSASWDEEREGTFLGTEEVKRNFGNIMDGLRRSSDRMDVEDMLTDQENQKSANRYERRKMRKQEDDQQ